MSFFHCVGAVEGGLVERLIELAAEVVDHRRIGGEGGAGEQRGARDAPRESTEVPFDIGHECLPVRARSGGAA